MKLQKKKKKPALHVQAVCFCALFMQLGRIEVSSYSHLKQTIPEFVWILFSWVSVRLFGPQPSAIAVFTLAKKVCNKEGNKFEIDSTEPNKTGVTIP